MTIAANAPTVLIPTPYVEHFGNSVVFGNHADMFPIIFQPFLAYPDWFFQDWIFQMINSIHNTSHPYYFGYGPIALGFSAFFFILGGVIACNTDDRVTREAMNIGNHIVSESFIERIQSGSIIGQLFVLPLVLLNVVCNAFFKLIVIALYWHILFAQIITLIVTLKGTVGYELTNLVGKCVMIAMIIAPLANMIVKSIRLLFIAF